MNDAQNTVESPVEASIAPEADRPTPSGKASYKPKKRKGARKGRERGAKVREYHARLLAEGKPEQAAAYREGREWAWAWLKKQSVGVEQLAQAAVDPHTAGGEGGKRGESVESGINSPSSPKIVSKAFSANGLVNESTYSQTIREGVFSPEQVGVICEIVSNAVSLAFKGIRAEDPHQDTTKEEKPLYWEETKVPVVWPVDGDDAFEVVITGAPPNKSLRLVQREGDSEVYQMWCSRDLWPMVGWRVACKPSDDPEKPGLVLLGIYNRGGLRVE